MIKKTNKVFPSDDEPRLLPSPDKLEPEIRRQSSFDKRSRVPGGLARKFLYTAFNTV